MCSGGRSDLKGEEGEVRGGQKSRSKGFPDYVSTHEGEESTIELCGAGALARGF